MIDQPGALGGLISSERGIVKIFTIVSHTDTCVTELDISPRRSQQLNTAKTQNIVI